MKALRRKLKGRTLVFRILGDANVYEKQDLGGDGEKITQSRKSIMRLLEKVTVVNGRPMPVAVLAQEPEGLSPMDPLARLLMAGDDWRLASPAWEAEHAKRLGLAPARVARAEAEAGARLADVAVVEKTKRVAKVEAAQ